MAVFVKNTGETKESFIEKFIYHIQLDAAFLVICIQNASARRHDYETKLGGLNFLISKSQLHLHTYKIKMKVAITCIVILSLNLYTHNNGRSNVGKQPEIEKRRSQ